MYFLNRREAGRILAEHLRRYSNKRDVSVLALPRGGVPVGYEVARRLNVPLDVFTVRKLGVPGHQELAMGAIATGGLRILHEGIIRELGISEQTIETVSEQEQRELERRDRIYRGDRPSPPIEGRTVIVVDDGLATGSTMKAAVQALRQRSPARLIVAVPTAPVGTCEELKDIADEVICEVTPDPFFAVGGSYADFSQTSDDEVRALIDDASRIASGRQP